MPGPAVSSPEATSRSCRSLRIQRTHFPRNDQAATDRPVSLKGAIHKNLSARASRFLRQRFGKPNLALLDPVCPLCRWGLRPPEGLGKGTHWTGGVLDGEGGRAASLQAAGEA